MVMRDREKQTDRDVQKYKRLVRTSRKGYSKVVWAHEED